MTPDDKPDGTNLFLNTVIIFQQGSKYRNNIKYNNMNKSNIRMNSMKDKCRNCT